VAKAIEQYEPQYLEDPTDSIADHAEVKKHTDIPTASNMCVSAFAHVKPNTKLEGIDIILGDHHAWGGILAYRETGVLCRVMGLGPLRPLQQLAWRFSGGNVARLCCNPGTGLPG
jgi:L-alanine-DL-glutamate epimerase-like enolase superfamily enzyme